MRLPALFLSLLLCGCSTFRVVQRDISDENNGREIVTTITGRAWFSSATHLTQLKALQTDKTQSFGAGTYGQQGATNGLAALELLARIAEAVRPTP